MIPHSDFWWKNVTGPQAFVKKVADTLLDHRMPLLKLPEDLPWRHSMRNAVLDFFREMHPDEEPYITIIDVADDCPEGDVGEFLLNRFALRGVANGYRSKSGKSIQQYLIDNGVLAQKILWIKGIIPEIMPVWIRFCQGYDSLSLSQGLFAIESCSSTPPIVREKFNVIDFNHFISRYDVQLFNSFLLPFPCFPLSRLWQNYVAVAAAQLCEFDAELSEALLQGANWRETDPRHILRELANESDFVHRGTACDANHVLACIRGNREEELNKRLWAAQVQILFPFIEKQRINIITKLENALVYILKNKYIEQFKQRVEAPQELELGTIIYLLTLKNQDGSRVLYVSDENLRKCIFLLHDCRNLLAHRHQCCSPEQVGSLLELENG